MLHAFDLHCGDGSSFDRRQQRTAQGITDGSSKPAFEWLRGKAAISFRQGLRVCRQTTRHLKSCPKIILIHSHSVQVLKMQRTSSDDWVTSLPVRFNYLL